MKIMAHDLPRDYWRKLAERNGLKYRTYWMRLQRGWTPEQAATTPTLHKATRKPDPNSTTQKLKAAGLHPRTVNDYRRNHPDTTLTDDEIIAFAVERRNQKSMAQRCREAGLHTDTVWARIHRQGWSVEEALSTPPMTPRQSGQMRAKQRKAQREAYIAENQARNAAMEGKA